jgi:hypothetical protein
MSTLLEMAETIRIAESRRLESHIQTKNGSKDQRLFLHAAPLIFCSAIERASSDHTPPTLFYAA